MAITTAIIAGSAIAGGAALASSSMGAKAAKKGQQAALSAAEAEAARAREEQLRIEEKFGTLTPEEQAREKENYELSKRRQVEYERRAGLTGEELIGEESSLNKDLINQLKSRQGLSGEELFASEGELNREIGQEALSDDPYAMLAPELELARQAVNVEANRRGVFGGQPEGGIRFEQLGRANVDLAVKAAQQRIAQRNSLANAYLTLGGNQRAESGTFAERTLSEKERARAELQSFLSGEQNNVAGAKGRTTGAALSGAAIGEAGAARAFDTTTDVFGQRAGAGAAMQAQGLKSLGQIGGNLISGGFNPSVPSTTTTDLTSLRGEDYNSLSGLRDISGAELLDQYDSIRRR